LVAIEDCLPHLRPEHCCARVGKPEVASPSFQLLQNTEAIIGLSIISPIPLTDGSVDEIFF
jgi:hypothetical protein